MNKIFNLIYKTLVNSTDGARLEFVASVLNICISLLISIVTILLTFHNTNKQIIESRKTDVKDNEYSEFLKDVKHCIIESNHIYFVSYNLLHYSKKMKIVLKHLKNVHNNILFKEVKRIRYNIKKYQKNILKPLGDVQAYCQLIKFNKNDRKHINDYVTHMDIYYNKILALNSQLHRLLTYVQNYESIKIFRHRFFNYRFNATYFFKKSFRIIENIYKVLKRFNKKLRRLNRKFIHMHKYYTNLHYKN